MFRYAKLFLILLLVILIVQALNAQEESPIATRLNNPRHIYFEADGTLYIAEAGIAGEESVPAPSGIGEVPAGTTARVTVILPNGDQAVLIDEMESLDLGDGQIVGVHAVYGTETAFYLVLGQGRTPGGPIYAQDVPMNGIAILDRDRMQVMNYIDLYNYESSENPDQSMEIGSNPMDFVFTVDGQTMYIADASANAVWQYKENTISVFASWPTDESGSIPASVPTSIEVNSAGEVYVGFLSGYPFEPESARIEVYSADGELLTTYRGLTYVTDILLADDGTLYAVEMSGGFVEDAFLPDSGRIVMVSEDGLVPVAEGLNFPFGLAQHPNGDLYVTINSEFSDRDRGQVVRVGQ